MILIRTILTGETPLLSFFPGLNPELECRAEVLSFSIAAPLFAAFIYSVFQKQMSRKFTFAIYVVGGVFSLFVALLPYHLSYHGLVYYQLWTILASGYIIFILIRSVFQKVESAPLFLLSFVIFVGSTLNDILVSQEIIHSIYVAPAGLLVFVVVQAMMINIKNARAFFREEVLSRKLEANNMELEATNLKLRELDKLKSAFLSTISHELRTPMTPILGFLSIIHNEVDTHLADTSGDLPAKALKSARKISEYVDIIAANADHLMKILEKILKLTELESGKSIWKMERIAVKALIEDFLVHFMPLYHEEIDRKGLGLSVHIDENLPDIEGDRRRLTEVLDNLFSNAVKFTEKGGISIQANAEKGLIQIRFADNGPGVSPENRKIIFEKFRQLGDVMTDKPEGIGIGLSICRIIVEHHRGAIDVQSDAGKGSVFCISLPAITEKDLPQAQ